jgi:uncharacterized Zn finger protein
VSEEHQGPPGPQQGQRRRRRRSRRRPGGGGRGPHHPDAIAPQSGGGDEPYSGEFQGMTPYVAPGAAPQAPPSEERPPRPRNQPRQPQQHHNQGGRQPQNQGGGRRNQRGRGRPHRGRRPWQRRGRGSEHWWARRWTDVLESFEVGRRLGRGRLYARQGQVLELEIGEGFVTAQVQGSRDAPYLVRMRFSMLSSTDWKKVTKELAADPVLGPALASGQMPEGVEDVFDRLGLSLFPRANGDLKSACSCPDPANPCKHVAAVYYLLGEEIDRDPYVLFRLRGMEKADLINALGGPLRGTPMPPPNWQRIKETERAAPPEPEEEDEERDDEELADENGDADADADSESDAEGDSDEDEDYGEAPAWADDPLEPEPPAEPLPTEPHAFWAGGDFGKEEVGEAKIPAVPAALTKRLGALPFQRGEDPSGLLERIYRNASLGGLEVFLGERAEEGD